MAHVGRKNTLKRFVLMVVALVGVLEARRTSEREARRGRSNGEPRKSLIGWKGESHVVEGRAQAGSCRALSRTRSGHLTNIMQSRNASIAVAVHRQGEKFATDAHGPALEALTDGRLAVAWMERQVAGVPKLRLRASKDKFARIWDEEVNTVHMAESIAWNPSLLSHKGFLHVYYVERDQRCQGSPSEGGIIRELRVNENSLTSSVPRTIAGPEEGDIRPLATTSRPLKLTSGEWIIPFRYLPACGSRQVDEGAAVLISNDEGRTWMKGKEVKVDNGPVLHSTLVASREGSLFMVLRTPGESLFATSSFDKGRTWSTPHILPIKNKNSNVDLVSLMPGEYLVLAYVGQEMPKHSTEDSTECLHCPWKIFMDVSADGGTTWMKFAAIDVKKPMHAQNPTIMQVGCSLSVFYSVKAEPEGGKLGVSTLTVNRVPIRAASVFVSSHSGRQ